MVNLEKLTGVEVLGLTIIGVARKGSIEEQVAVGCVARNRMIYDAVKYKSYYDVCMDAKVFKCWVDDLDYLSNLALKVITQKDVDMDLHLHQCMFVAQGVKDMIILDNTNGCKHFLDISTFRTKRPAWAVNATKVREIGNHIFFHLPVL